MLDLNLRGSREYIIYSLVVEYDVSRETHVTFRSITGPLSIVKSYSSPFPRLTMGKMCPALAGDCGISEGNHSQLSCRLEVWLFVPIFMASSSSSTITHS